MTERASAFIAELAALRTDDARLHAGVPALRALYRDVLRAAAPPNPQYERERIIAQAPNPRELVFLFGVLSEGENEAALLLELMADVRITEPGAPVAHLVDEAWYYLRTSIDEHWQLDDGPPSAGGALGYLLLVLTERLERLRCAPQPVAVAQGEPDRAALLRSLRDRFE